MDRRTSLKLMAGAAAAAKLGTSGLHASGHTEQRPNIILIVVDDLRWDEFGAGGHPYLQTPNIDRLAEEGAQFSRAMHATPLCSPNRACILTGQYTATHAIYNNADRGLLSHLLPTFPQELQRTGYVTGLVGKWHMGNDAAPRPGFDYWVSFPGQGRILDPELFENGRLGKVSGYITDLLTDRALGFIRQQKGSRRPYFLYLAHKAVHPDAIQRDDGAIDKDYGMRYIAAERHRGRYRNAVFPRSNMAKSAQQGTLGSVMVRRFLERKRSPDTVRQFGDILDPGTSEQSIRDRAEMMLAIDEGVGHILSELEASGQLENTVIAFTSDNGFFFGEHGLSIERRLPYEECIRSPLLIRYPKRVKSGSEVDALVSSVDIAPTLLEFASAKIGRHIQGVSFAGTLSGLREGPRRASVLIENFSDDRPMPWVLDADYKAIRTERYKLIHWIKSPELDELYDLQVDPREERNLIASRDHVTLIPGLKLHLASLVRSSISL